jgi:hypothetical protein
LFIYHPKFNLILSQAQISFYLNVKFPNYKDLFVPNYSFPIIISNDPN